MGVAASPTLPGPLLAISPGALRGKADRDEFVRRAGAAFEAGLRALIVREPGLDERAYLALLRRLLDGLARFDGAWIAAHDRVHAALAAGVHGVQLGFRSLAPREARALCAGRLALGFSAHAGDPEGAREGADYLLLGPVRATPSKAGRLEPLGFEGLAAAARAEERPLWAIGGLRPEHAAPALAAGARGVAALSGIWNAPARAVPAYLAALERA